MPARPRRSAADSNSEATVTSINRNDGPLRTTTGNKIAKGRIVGDVRHRTTSSNLSVAEFRMADVKDPSTTWTVTAWRDRADEVFEKLQRDDVVKVVGRWEADREWDRGEHEPKGRATNNLTATVSIGVELADDKLVDLGDFDRAEANAIKATKELGAEAGILPDAPADDFGVA